MPTIGFDPTTTRVAPAETPDDARGANFSDAVGQGLSQIGQQADRLTTDVARIQYQQKISDGVTSIKQNMMAADEDFSSYMDDQKSKVAVNGAGYVDAFKEKFDPWAQQLMDQQTDPKLKKIAAEQLATFHNRFYNQAAAWQSGTNRAWRMDTFNQSIQQDSATIDADPSQYEALQKNQLESIDALSGELHPADKIELANKVRDTYAQAAALSWARTHPQDTINSILPGTVAPPDSIPAKITAAATAKGIDPHTALAISQFESGMNPAAKNPNSSASGLFQMINSTGDQYYDPGADRSDPDAQINAGVKLVADNTKAMRSMLGRDPTTPEVYSAHLLGFSGATLLAKAPATESFADLAQKMDPKNANAVVVNNGFSGLTVGQVRDKIGGWMNGAMVKTAGMANQPTDQETADDAKQPLPWLDNLSPNGRQAILTHAQNQVKKDDSGARAQLNGQMADQIAADQRGEGGGVQNRVTLDTQLAAGVPMQQAILKQQELNQWQTFGAARAKVNTATPAEMQQLIQQATPQPGTQGFAQAAEQHDALIRAADYVTQQRQADPIRADSETMQTTKPLDFSNPQFLTGPLNARFHQAGQVAENFGTPYQPFSKPEAQQLGGFLQQATPKDALGYLTSMAAAADTPDHFHAAMAQIAPDHPNLAVAGQLALHDPQAASLVIQGDRMLKDKDKIPLPQSPKFSQAWDQQRGAAYAGLPQTSQSDMQAAIAHYVASQPAGARSETLDTDLWKKSMDAIAPSTDYNGRTTLVPAGTDPSKFPDTIAARWPQALSAAGLDATQYPASAYSLASAGQDGVYVPYSGTMPLMANGRRVVIDLNEPGQAPATHTPDSPDQAQRNLKGKRLSVADLNPEKRFR